MTVTGTTRMCVSLANPNRGTPGPGMHNAAFAALGLDYVYTAAEPDDIGAGLAAVRALKMPGCSISKPFKTAAVAHVDRLDPVAAEIGAVNTVVNDEGALVGHNTDWVGVVAALRAVMELGGARVAILGAGGAAQAAVFGLVRAGARPTVFNRSPGPGVELADRYGLDCGGPLEALAGRDDFDVVINCTSLGRHDGERLPVSLEQVPGLSAVLDVTFTQATTALLDQAQALGVTAVHGSEMLVEQGAVQFQMFTGHQAPRDVMRAAVRAHLFPEQS